MNQPSETTPTPTTETAVKETVHNPVVRARRRVFPTMKKIAAIGILTLVTKGTVDASLDLTKQNNINPNNSAAPSVMYEPSAASSPQAEAKDSSTEKKKETIEQKYGIKLYLMKDGYAALSIPYNEQDPALVGPNPPVRWNDSQLDLLSTLLPILPPRLYDGVKIFLADFSGTNFQGQGESFGNGIIGFQSEAINPTDPNGTLSLLVHELTHNKNDEGNGALEAKVKQILSSNDYLKLKEFQPDTKPQSLGDRVAALATLGSFAPDQQIAHDGASEGTAGFSQLYVIGKDRFFKAVAPLLDGQGYDDNQAVISDGNAVTLYPKTNAIYELYKNDVFAGEEYPIESQDVVNMAIIAIENKYNVKVLENKGAVLTIADTSTLGDILNSLPRSFYKSPSGTEFGVTIIGPDGKQNDSQDYTGIGTNVFIREDELVKYTSDFQAKMDILNLFVEEQVLNQNNALTTQVTDILGPDFFQASRGQIDITGINPQVASYINNTFQTKPESGKTIPLTLAASLGTLYIQGWDDFKGIGVFTDPGVSMDGPSAKSTKAWSLYLIYKAFYGGQEYNVPLPAWITDSISW